ncbi:MAG: hypothetical protein V2A70_08395 [Candidatus Omnitrophota bacterium]
MGKKLLMGIMAALFSVSFALPASAQVTLDDVLKRVEALERENSMLKDQVMALKNAPAPVASYAAAPAGNFLETKFKTKMYGYIKADAVFNDSALTTTGGTLSMYPTSETTTKHNDNFAMAANETRLGFDIEAPAMDDGGVVSGKIEGDFWSSTNTGSVFRLRQAYAKLAYSSWDVLAGQTWDFFSPLGPSTLDFGYGWNAGNIGDRHPQVILSNKIADDFLGGKLSTKVGVVDPNLSTQSTSGFPVSGALAQYDGKVLSVPTTVYVAGIYGRLESQTGTKYRDALYAGTSGMTIKLTDWLSLKGEGYIGSGLSTFRSAGFSTTAIDNGNQGIDSRGGFAELTLKPIKKLESNTGLGVDVVTSPLTSAATTWKRNNMYYTNLKYSISKDLLVGIEYQRFKANFADNTKGSDNRVQTSVIYKF